MGAAVQVHNLGMKYHSVNGEITAWPFRVQGQISKPALRRNEATCGTDQDTCCQSGDPVAG